MTGRPVVRGTARDLLFFNCSQIEYPSGCSRGPLSCPDPLPPTPPREPVAKSHRLLFFLDPGGSSRASGVTDSTNSAGRLGLEPRLHGSKGRRAADYPISHRTPNETGVRIAELTYRPGRPRSRLSNLRFRRLRWRSHI